LLCGSRAVKYNDLFTKIYGGVIPCLEHISPRKDTEKRSTASEREWLPLTAERFSREDVPKAEQDSPINSFKNHLSEVFV